MKTKLIKIMVAALSVLLLLTGCGSTASLQSPGQDVQADAQTQEYEFGMRGTNLSLSEDKELNISRIPDIKGSPAPKDGIWTVFVYMCGSDLESNGGCASADLNEMINATSECLDLRFVVETGGSLEWQSVYGVDGKNLHLVIEDGEVAQIGEPFEANMGDPDTLINFLDWGLENYRSQYIMLDMWDHGCGSLIGVCVDERSSDMITLKELDQSLAYVLGNREVKLDMIGCDACLMATIEMANICVPYADYMICSEEVEWGGGWDYSGFSDGINSGTKRADELGKYICDSFYNSMNSYEDVQKESTLSVIDLSKVDSLLLTFNSFCIDVYDSMMSDYDEVMQKINSNAIFFSNGSAHTGDMLSFIKSTSAFSDKSERVLSRLNECVLYARNGNTYKDAGGLAMIMFQGSSGLSTNNLNYLNLTKNLCVTPYYMGILSATLYGSTTMGDITGYDPDEWIDEDSEYWTDNDVDGDEYVGWNNEDDGSLNITDDNVSMLFVKEPHIESRKRESQDFINADSVGEHILNWIMNGVGNLVSGEYNVYTFTLSDAGMQKVGSIHTRQFWRAMDSDNNSLLLDLGGEFRYTGDEIRENNYSTFEEEFYGMTVGLPNGSPICIEPISRLNVEGYGTVQIYSAPVTVNGVNKNLILSEEYVEYSAVSGVIYTAIGVTDLDSEISRIEPLKSGDVIKALFPAYYEDTFEFAGYYKWPYATDYVLGTDGEFGLIWQAYLPKGNYLLCYRINDIYGNTFCTPFAKCVVDPDDVYPYSMIGMLE